MGYNIFPTVYFAQFEKFQKVQIPPILPYLLRIPALSSTGTVVALIIPERRDRGKTKKEVILVKTLLTITVLVSSALSIFSSSLKLYEVPVFKEAVSVIGMGKEVQASKERKDPVKIYISHDVSNEGKEKQMPLLIAEEKVNVSKPQEDHINVFGVRIPHKSDRSNI